MPFWLLITIIVVFWLVAMLAIIMFMMGAARSRALERTEELRHGLQVAAVGAGSAAPQDAEHKSAPKRH